MTGYQASMLAALAMPAAIYAQAPSQGELAPLTEAVARVTPQWAGQVEFRMANTPAALDSHDGRLRVTAPNRRECLRAYGYYLRTMAGVHLSRNGDNATAARLVLPLEPVVLPPAPQKNFAFNYCTLSYSGAHWDRARWERELDLLALCGYRYVLVTSGLEAVWQDFLTGLGCTPQQIENFIASPVYAAWWHMGNLEGEGGPVHPDIIRREAELGKFLVQRARELGMEPVLQAYTGFLPHDVSPDQAGGRVLPQGKWVEVYDRPAVLDPASPAFPQLAARWYQLLEKHYGCRATAFCGDLFHEGGNSAGCDLRACARAIQQGMQAASPGSTWFLQAWGHNPLPQLLAGLDRAHSCILLLDKNLTPDHDPYYRDHPRLARPQVQGFPQIWCELANFGGKQVMYGGFPLLEKPVPFEGIGMLSEGLETNPLYDALLTERANLATTAPIDRNAFLARYAHARYGVEDARLVQALSLLADSVYNPTGMREGGLENILCARPSLSAQRVSTWASSTPYYTHTRVEQAARLLLAAGREHHLDALPTFRYDLADLSRQVLADRARPLLRQLEADYQARDTNAFAQHSGEFLELIRQSADVLATSEFFLLGAYEKGAAERAGDNPQARAQMVQALRRLITTWAPDNSPLNDYAHREFSETMRHYYLPRWQVYLDRKLAELKNGAATTAATSSATVTNNGEAVSTTAEMDDAVDAIQRAFPTATFPVLTSPQGNALHAAQQALGE